jgi:hypothetical protein
MELATTLSAISAAKDFAALIIGRKIDAAVTDKAIELQNAIIALQSGILEMQAQIQALSQQNRELATLVERAAQWAVEEDKHELATIAKGVHVVVRKTGTPSTKGSPWYCANCWQKRFKSVFQYETQNYGGTQYYCPNCDAKIYDHSDPDLS